MWALYQKEIRSFLVSLTGMVVIGIFLMVTGLFLWVFPSDMNVLDNGYANLDGLFSLAPYVLLFLVPAISMRSFAEEKRSGTLELLLTRPLSELQIVLAKYLSAFTLVFMSVLPTLIYYFSIQYLAYPVGNIDNGGFWGSFIGLLMLGATFTAIGQFCSSITDNQVVAFLIAVVFSAFLYLGFDLLASFFGDFNLFVQGLGMEAHYRSMSRGVIDTRDLLYFLSVIGLFIYLTTYSLTGRKWKG